MAGPIYTYTPDTPTGPEGMNVTQPFILENFQSIEELLTVNHVDFNTPNTFGFHTFASLPSQSTVPVTSATEIALFCAPSTGTNPFEIYTTTNGALTGTQLSNLPPVLPDQETSFQVFTFASGLTMISFNIQQQQQNTSSNVNFTNISGFSYKYSPGILSNINQTSAQTTASFYGTINVTQSTFGFTNYYTDASGSIDFGFTAFGL